MGVLRGSLHWGGGTKGITDRLGCARKPMGPRAKMYIFCMSQLLGVLLGPFLPLHSQCRVWGCQPPSEKGEFNINEISRTNKKTDTIDENE